MIKDISLLKERLESIATINPKFPYDWWKKHGVKFSEDSETNYSDGVADGEIWLAVKLLKEFWNE